MDGPNDSCFVDGSNDIDGQWTDEERTTSTRLEFTVSPAPCQCRQIDINHGGGGQGFGIKGGNWSETCEPAPEPVVCNGLCGPSTSDNAPCSGNLVCHNTGSDNRCRLSSNRSSTSCQPAPPQEVGCNQACNNSSVICAAANHTCLDADGDGQNECRRTDNPTSATCEALITDIAITKTNTNGVNFIPEQTVGFQVDITNNGNQTISGLSFSDNYDSEHLQLVSLSGQLVGSDAVQLVTSGAASSDGVALDTNAGQLDIANLAGILGSSASGEIYRLSFSFDALSVTSYDCAAASAVNTCNIASFTSGSINNSSQACACISEEEAPEPEVLPETGLFDEDSRHLLIGIVLIFVGILINRVLGDNGILAYAVITTRDSLDKVLHGKKDMQEIKKEREKFERKIIAKD